MIVEPGDCAGLFETAHDDEQRSEEQQQRPFDAVDRIGRVPLSNCDHHRTRGDRDERQGAAPEPRDHRGAEQRERLQDQGTVECHRHGFEPFAKRLAQLGAICPPEVGIGDRETADAHRQHVHEEPAE